MRKKSVCALVLLPVLFLMWGCAPAKVRMNVPGPSPGSVSSAPSSPMRENIVQTAISLHGNPYKSGAKGADAFDCSGFVHFVYKRHGINLPVSTDKLVQSGIEIPKDQVQPGDLVFFRIKKDLHIGIMVNSKEFIHASKSRGIALDDVEASYWRRNFLSYRSVLG